MKARSSRPASINDLPPMDLCALAVELGCGFVARGYAGDPKQMVEHPQSRHRPRRPRGHRRHLALRHLQQSRRLDEGLHVLEGARRAAPPDRLRAVVRTDRDRLRARHDARSDAARRLAPAPEKAGRGLRPVERRAGAAALAQSDRRRRHAHRPRSTCARRRRASSPC